MMYATGVAAVLNDVGLWEIVGLLGFLVVLLWLVPKSLPGLMRVLGRSKGEYEKGKISVERELELETERPK